MKDVTAKYINMINSFDCDFQLSCDTCSDFDLYELQEQINEMSNFTLLRDIKLLNELSFNLRHNIYKIIQLEE